MSERTERILEQALALPPSERADLAERLLASLDQTTDSQIDALWALEAESRIAAIRLGQMATVSAEEVFDEIEGQEA